MYRYFEYQWPQVYIAVVIIRHFAGSCLFRDTAAQAAIVSSLAGTAGIRGHSDGVGSSALFNFPLGVALDAVGSIGLIVSKSMKLYPDGFGVYWCFEVWGDWCFSGVLVLSSGPGRGA